MIGEKKTVWTIFHSLYFGKNGWWREKKEIKTKIKTKNTYNTIIIYLYMKMRKKIMINTYFIKQIV